MIPLLFEAHHHLNDNKVESIVKALKGNRKAYLEEKKSKSNTSSIFVETVILHSKQVIASFEAFFKLVKEISGIFFTLKIANKMFFMILRLEGFGFEH